MDSLPMVSTSPVNIFFSQDDGDGLVKVDDLDRDETLSCCKSLGAN
jgi:hypothetical protein